MSTIKFVIGEEIEQKHRPYDPADPLNYRKVALKHNYIPGTISAYIYGRKQRLRKSEFREIPPNFVDLGLGTGEIAIVDYQYIE